MAEKICVVYDNIFWRVFRNSQVLFESKNLREVEEFLDNRENIARVRTKRCKVYEYLKQLVH